MKVPRRLGPADNPRVAMNERDMTADVGSEDFAGELCDEALDREDERIATQLFSISRAGD